MDGKWLDLITDALSHSFPKNEDEEKDKFNFLTRKVIRVETFPPA